MALASELLDILVCPEDKGSLIYVQDEDLLYNPRLHRRYDIRNGNIAVLLIDQASAVSDDEHERLTKKAASEGLRVTAAQSEGNRPR